jgi:hypothetical protein
MPEKKEATLAALFLESSVFVLVSGSRGNRRISMLPKWATMIGRRKPLKLRKVH